MKRYRRRAEVNLVPLIDVLIVLIFFCLLTMQFKHMRSVNICPPKMDSAENSGKVSLVVTVSREGKYFYNNLPAEDRELGQKLSSLKATTPLLIVADENVPLKRVAFVMDEARKANLDIHLQTR